VSFDPTSPFEPEPALEFPSRAGRRRRRRRPRRHRGRGFAWLLPHLFTTGNLAAGFYAIVRAAEGDLVRAALAIIVAGILDGLDGRVARRVGATSPFGLEYDSIADAVSFGVAPAVIAWSAGALQDLGWTGWVLAFVYAVCAALRLARFNVTPPRFAGRFQGLPSPAAAGMVAASALFSAFLQEHAASLELPALLPGLGVALLGLLMVSSIPYRSFKDLDVRGSYRTLVGMVIVFAVILLEPYVTLFVLGLVYVSSGPAEFLWRWRTGQELEPIVPSEPLPDEEPGGPFA
jgi:CDP-diacylglycerol--serine O-phosphatidyltransferase